MKRNVIVWCTRTGGAGLARLALPGCNASAGIPQCRRRAETRPTGAPPAAATTGPARIVPMLADEEGYLASESRFHRVLRAEGQTTRHGRAKAPQATRPPTTHVASGPNWVWCWDMTFLPTVVLGGWFYYLYLILDLYSHKIVGWEVHFRSRNTRNLAPVEPATLNPERESVVKAVLTDERKKKNVA